MLSWRWCYPSVVPWDANLATESLSSLATVFPAHRVVWTGDTLPGGVEGVRCLFPFFWGTDLFCTVEPGGLCLPDAGLLWGRPGCRGKPLLIASLLPQPHQPGWLAGVLVPGHGKRLWHAGVCSRAGVGVAASAPGIARVSTGPDIERLGNVYQSSWGREKQKPPPKGRDMRQRWACIAHQQPGGLGCGLQASLRPAQAAGLGGLLCSPSPSCAQCCTDPACSQSTGPLRGGLSPTSPAGIA